MMNRLLPRFVSEHFRKPADPLTRVSPPKRGRGYFDRLSIGSTLALAMLACPMSSVAVEPVPGEIVPSSVSVSYGDGVKEEMEFMLFVPRGYARARSEGATESTSGAKRYPLVLFLHGRGESGTGGPDLPLVNIHGPLKFLAKHPEFSLIVVAPQCPRPPDGGVPEAWKADRLEAFLDVVSRTLPVDTDRVYVTGLSMGGYGTWRLAAMARDRFAAAIPICGEGQTEWAEKLKSLPIWAFHGEKDEIVPVAGTLEMIKAIQAAGGPAKVTIYPGVGHDSWTATYQNPEIYRWLLQHRREP